MLKRQGVRLPVQGAQSKDRQSTVNELIARFKPKRGDILLFNHPERLRSHLISWFTRSPYYHVGIYAGNGEVIEARLPQVVRRNLYYQKDGFQFVVIHAPNRFAAAAALDWASSKVGAHYDLRNLIWWTLGRLFHIPRLCRLAALDRYVCGNFVVQAFKAAGIDLFPGKTASEICPADFGTICAFPIQSEKARLPRHARSWHKRLSARRHHLRATALPNSDSHKAKSSRLSLPRKSAHLTRACA